MIRLSKLAQPLICTEECVLRNVLRPGMVQHSSIRNGMDALLIPTHQNAKGVSIAFKAAAHQQPIWLGLDSTHSATLDTVQHALNTLILGRLPGRPRKPGCRPLGSDVDTGSMEEDRGRSPDTWPL